MRARIAPTAVLWLLVGAAYFLIPLIAMLIFSLRSGTTGKCCTGSNYGEIFGDPELWRSLKQSFFISLETIAVALALLIPTVYWVHLKLPRLRALIGFLALIPFVVPPIILVVGLLDFYKGSPQWFYAQPYGFLVAAYVILAFPYIYFSLDSGFRAIDVHTLTEASQSLGATWRTTLFRVILPNVRTAALAGAFLTLAIVMGEFTIANLSAFHTFPIY
ncbi:MAG TPA: ABC transporter permease subunit, partial [Gaiellaceae bacterium]|nr:ABC transporter permease subunit [Gaiellaceae bacterium]